jgi:hypothetical protein
LATTKIGDDEKKNLLPTNFKDWSSTKQTFNGMGQSAPDYCAIDLPPLMKDAPIKIIKAAQLER